MRKKRTAVLIGRLLQLHVIVYAFYERNFSLKSTFWIKQCVAKPVEEIHFRSRVWSEIVQSFYSTYDFPAVPVVYSPALNMMRLRHPRLRPRQETDSASVTRDQPRLSDFGSRNDDSRGFNKTSSRQNPRSGR